MSLLEITALVVFVCALVPAVVFLCNLPLYRAPLPVPASSPRPAVSVLIPARNEEGAIAEALRSVLESEGIELDVVVLDDQSEDGTADAVRRVAAGDGRVRLATAPPLPPGWCGKQYACAVLATLARYETLVFLDADVRLERDGLARAVAALRRSDAALVSGFPRQITGSWLERLLIPLIHFLLLGFLPLRRMRRSASPAYGAGCGQLMVVHRQPYRLAGGHGALRSSRHDGLELPRALRRAGFRTDLFDATDVARCRMYVRAGEVWNGLMKNATEGLAAPETIVPATALLLAGQVVPLPLLAVAMLTGGSSLAVGFAAAALALSLVPRVVAAPRFHQSWWGVVGHPLGVLLLLAIQWQALLRERLGRPAAWKGRALPRPS